ncbi:Trypsin-1 [Melipona quadrifasciata]|uniref:Trypsin-1 n=1 Tax=Melipona quadrifasciata TaxID=166423 RepID=A0A0M8ZSP6_9HYME|nr:Trypsin-1 [Melipona quadrifasciata]
MSNILDEAGAGNTIELYFTLFHWLLPTEITAFAERYSPADYRERIVSESAGFPGPAESRIIGGKRIGIEEYPFAVSITIRVKAFHVRAGTSRYYEGGDIYSVQSVVIHPAFNAINYDYDVGLVELSDKIKYDDTKQPIQLPKIHSMIDDDSLVSVLGWGAHQLFGPVSNELLFGTMRKINNHDCEEANDGDLLTDRMFCALSDTARLCVGDSGSPLIFQNRLFGVASWSRSCDGRYPTTFTAIAELKDWISDVTSWLLCQNMWSDVNDLDIRTITFERHLQQILTEGLTWECQFVQRDTRHKKSSCFIQSLGFVQNSSASTNKYGGSKYSDI